MYKDLRPVASTPDMWAENFRSRLRVQDRLSGVRLRRDPRWREIRRRVPAGGRIVDMGSGLGQWVAFLAGSGDGAAGVDYSAPPIATARARHRARATTGAGVDPGADGGGPAAGRLRRRRNLVGGHRARRGRAAASAR